MGDFFHNRLKIAISQVIGLASALAGKADVANATLSGTVAVTGQLQTVEEDKGTLNAGSHNVNWDDGNLQLMTIAGNVTLTFTNPKAGAAYTLVIKNNGGFTVTLPAVTWVMGGATGAVGVGTNQITVIALRYTALGYLATISST